MLTNAVITPHPPILIPEIGKENLKQIANTRAALNLLGESFSKTNPDHILIISPHGQVFYDRMCAVKCALYKGGFSQFGAYQTSLQFKGEENLPIILERLCLDDNLPLQIMEKDSETALDHGALVPLFYLAQNLQQSASILPISFSMLSPKTHFRFGQIIGQMIDNTDRKIAVIASGDLSHRLIPEAPDGYNPQGKIFDQTLIELLKNNDSEGILGLSEDFTEQAGECGLRSIFILLGLLSNRDYHPEILSYEGPFGVGYLVANMNLR